MNAVHLSVASLLALGAATIAVVGQRSARTPEPSGLTAFRSDAELRAFLQRVAKRRAVEEATASYDMAVPAPSPPPPPAMEAPAPVVVTASRAPEAITNTQVAGVDEGGIVKFSGETLVILRRGRLFTVSLAHGGMRPLASIDAHPPGVDGRGDWYDEMLLSGDRVVVVGYSYARGGTEVNRFRLGRDGSLRFADSTQLRSDDYYSSRNYASRLIGSKLVHYAPLSLGLGGADLFDALPAIREWRPDMARGGGWRRVVAAQRVFLAPAFRSREAPSPDTVHSVTTCDLLAARPTCEATAVLGSSSRSFYVSTNAVYVWTGAADERGRAMRGLLYRLPFDAARPQAVGVRGAPIDQFSFNADPARRGLNVLVSAEGAGDAMWRPERAASRLALLRLPMAEFGSGAREVALDRYQPLPSAPGWSLQNRFVGDHLLYGAEGMERLVVVGVGDRHVAELAPPHGVSRLDVMGAEAIAVGEGRGALNFSTVELGRAPRLADTFRLPAAREGESRSHAFFLRAATPDGRSGLLGLPVARSTSEGTRFPGASAAIRFLRRRDARLADAGELAARGTGGSDRDDGCIASCVDWYGNARPIFWRGRVFALMGYEVVEGREAESRVVETRRISFAPRRPVRRD